MAFDMRIRGGRESIGDHEEDFFRRVTERDDYPQLNALWEAFYDGPRIAPEIAGALAAECARLSAELSPTADEALIVVLGRLARFFTLAQQQGEQITCLSD